MRKIRGRMEMTRGSHMGVTIGEGLMDQDPGPGRNHPQQNFGPASVDAGE